MSLEREKLKVQFKRVELAKLELELKIKERFADIERMEVLIKTQESRLEEIESQLKEK